MEFWQKAVVLIFGLFSFWGFFKALNQCQKKNPFGLAPLYNLLGAFVWGDVVVFGLFWLLVTILVLVLNDWVLFLLILSLFWLFRSLGEMFYWSNQQFSEKLRNPPQTLRMFKLFADDSIWFVHQIIYQCLAVITTVLSLYLARLWLIKF